jgi:DNA (cytosine-5)-methyltransferase 1
VGKLLEEIKILLKTFLLCSIIRLNFDDVSNVWRCNMAASYNKLWKQLIDRKMTKTQLVKLAGITTNAMARLGRDEDVRVEVLVKICSALGCTMNDIMDIVPDREA